MDIGKKISDLRRFNNLTQDELAKKCELTKGFISQVESNKTPPSMKTFFEILEVLGTNPKEFFGNDRDDDYEKISFKEEEFSEVVDNNLYSNITYIVPNAMKFEMDPILVSIQPGGRTASSNPHPGEEFGYVLIGQVTVVYGRSRHTVRKGETFYYYANKEHYLENNGTSVAKVLWISTPPNF